MISEKLGGKEAQETIALIDKEIEEALMSILFDNKNLEISCN